MDFLIQKLSKFGISCIFSAYLFSIFFVHSYKKINTLQNLSCFDIWRLATLVMINNLFNRKSCSRFKSNLICQLLELNAPTCYSHQTSPLKSSENVDNQSYYIVGCSLTAHRKTNVSASKISIQKRMYQHQKYLFRNFGSKFEVTTTRPRQILQKKWYILIEREKKTGWLINIYKLLIILFFMQ